MVRLLPLSTGCQYAVRTVAQLAVKPPGEVVSRSELSAGTGIPASFLSKILQVLAREGVVRSHRGRTRGYSLARSPDDISVLEIVEAYDGPFDDSLCVLDGYRLCSLEETCTLHRSWTQVRKQAENTIKSLSIRDFAKVLGKRRYSGRGPR